MRLLATVCAAALACGLSAPIPAQTPPSAPAAVVEPGFVTDGLSEPSPEPRDRYEKLNRGIWGFNMTVDRIVLKPVSTGYRKVVPRIARRGISNAFDNLSEPWSFLNNLAQGHPGRALNNLARFLINTTIGLAGLFDHATRLGVAPRPEDFGQTLAVWGVKSSAYLVLPVLGPSTVRDGVGTGVAFFADPYQICLNECTDLSRWTKRGIAALSVVSTRADLTESGADAFLQSSLDPYAAARSAFLQRRAVAIANRDDADGTETNATDSSAADPMTGISAPGAPATDIPPAPAATPDAVPAPDAVPSAAPTAPGDAAPVRTSGLWNRPRLAYVLD